MMGKLPLSEYGVFSFGALAKDAGNAFIGLYYMFFLTQVLKLNAAVIGSVFAIVRLIIAFSSPLFGTLIDNTRTRRGKYLPWIIISAIFGGACLFIMYYKLDSNIILMYIFYLSFYVLWELSSLSLDIAYWALLPALSEKNDERNKLISFSKMTSGVGNLLIAAGAPFFLTLYFISEYEPEGYKVLGIIVGSMVIISGVLIYLKNKERLRVEGDIIKVRDLFKALFRNDQLIVFFFSFLLINMSAVMTGNFALYFFAYDIGEIKYFGLFAVLTGLGQGLGLITYPYLSKVMSVRKILLIAALTSIIGYGLMLIIVGLLGSKNIIILSSAAVIMLFSVGWIATASQAMLSDITDYGEYKLKSRTQSIVYSANSMMWRILSAIVILSLGLSLSIAGISGVDLESGYVPELSIKSLWLIRIMMLGVPMLLISGGLIIFLTKYRLNNKEMEHILNSLKERHYKTEQKLIARQESKLLALKLKQAKRESRVSLSYTCKGIPKERKLSLEYLRRRLSSRNKDKD